MLELEYKYANCVPQPLHLYTGYHRDAVYPDGVDPFGDDEGETLPDDAIHVVPLPQRCQPFKKRQYEVTGGHSVSRSSNLPQGQGSYVSFERTWSGKSTLTTRANAPCQYTNGTCNTGPTSEGTADWSDISIGRNYYYNDGSFHAYEESKRTISLEFGGSTAKLPNPHYEPDNDPPEDEFIWGDHDSFIVTNTLVTKTPEFDNDNSFTGFDTETTTSKFFDHYHYARYGVVEGIYETEITYSNTDVSHKVSRKYSAPSNDDLHNAVRAEEITELEPFTEEDLIAAAKGCANSKDWSSGKPSVTDNKALWRVDYSEEVLLDPDTGEVIMWDHDGDENANPPVDPGNQTPRVPKTEERTECFDLVFASKMRYRVRIPHDFDPPPFPDSYDPEADPPMPILASYDRRWHGKWHRVQFVETFTPFDHIPMPEPPVPDENGNISEEDQEAYEDAVEESENSPQPVETEKEVIWSGPGQLIDFDGFDDLTNEQKENRRDSWVSGWLETGYPPGKGDITVRMKRSQCYHGAPWVYH